MSRELEFSITSSQTTIRVSTTLNQAEFPIPGVIQIGTEKIRYDNLTNREFTACTRGYLNTVAAAHAMEDDVIYVSSVPHIATTVESIKSDNEAELVGDVHLISGTNVTLTQVGNDITLDANGWDVPEDTISVDSSSVAGNTRLLLWDVDSGALVRVSVGADDSGGAASPAVAASGNVAVIDYTQLQSAYAAADVLVVDYTQLTGATLTIGTDVLTEGVDWTAATSNNDTASSLASAIDTLVDVHADVTANTISVIANVAGTAGNSITLVSSDPINLELGGPNLTDGVDGGILTINGTALVEGIDWTASSDNTVTANSLASAINTKIELSGVVTASPGASNGFDIDAVDEGIAGNSISLETSDAINLVISGATLTGGADASIGYKILRIPN